ncbi:hypothetical protein GCM10014715_74800 [Streptomyces spiralis]|uniref:Uncharacterized protein n=1 Tax=Streptomyces spiralis TaxID=66376 RepID=A0A919AHY8_9ACTN|nr:hypothetical protein [Streptomyces spiralis]GHF07936.1 hypothetical protein GCM10014715_74800 [Streptomyces spiralis]
MIREDKFRIARRPYAVDLGSLRVGGSSEHGWHRAQVTAVWFRGRPRGLIVACIGALRTSQRPAPETVVEFLERYDDGRYGGDCDGRWDGENYWGAQKPEVIEQHLAILRPMLAHYPALPTGDDGWWTFRDGGISAATRQAATGSQP